MSTSHLAAIDLGTNSFHLVVVRTDERGKFEIVSDEKESVRLGSGGGDLGNIAEDAFERGLATLTRFARIARSHDAEIRAVATSALREARNRDDFIRRAREEIGLEIEVIQGTEEARLIYLGVLQAIPVYNKRVLVLDIGGGSTEFLIGTAGHPEYAVSRKLGAIRLKDRFFAKEPLKANLIEECRHFVRVQLSGVFEDLRNSGFEAAVGCSGTIETLAKMAILTESSDDDEDHEFKDLHLSRSGLDRAVERILSVPTHRKRAKLPGLDDKRADIIIGGALLLQEIFAGLDIEDMAISPYALREGVIFDSVVRRTERAGSIPDIRRESVKDLAQAMLGHDPTMLRSAWHIAFLSVRLFDELRLKDLLKKEDFADPRHPPAPDEPVFSLNDSFLLESAAVLHNIGMFIAHSAHHKHSYYVIRNSDTLLGFTRLEIEIIALTARYHRKAAPTMKHSEFAALPVLWQRRLTLFSAILRICVGLERGADQSVQNLSVEENEAGVAIVLEPVGELTGPRDVALEIWAAEARKQELEDVLGKKVTVRI